MIDFDCGKLIANMEQALEESGKSKTQVAHEIGVDRKTLFTAMNPNTKHVFGCSALVLAGFAIATGTTTDRLLRGVCRIER